MRAPISLVWCAATFPITPSIPISESSSAMPANAASRITIQGRRSGRGPGGRYPAMRYRCVAVRMMNERAATASDASVAPSRLLVASSWNVVPALMTVVRPSSSVK